jgi:hypothetical protein
MSGGSPLKIALLFSLVCALAIAAYPQSAASAGIDQVYLAKDNGKGEAGEAASVFKTTDIPIYCVVKLDSTATVTVKMNLVAENVPGVKADTNVVSYSYTTKKGENRVNFYGRPAGKWTAGRYRADIFIEGKLSRNLTFEIRDTAQNSSGIKSFQPPKPSVRLASKPHKSPYMRSTAGVTVP